MFAIKFLHSFNFSESYSVTIVKPMLFLIMKVDNSHFLLTDTCNIDRLLLLTSGIENFMIVAKINESKSVESQIASVNEPNIFVSACFVERYQIISIEAI